MAEILIVDDDPQLRRSFGRILQSEGHTVRLAASGEAGLEEVKTRVPDLVILDVRLPGMSGLETYQAIRDVEAKLPVIIMTAYGTTETAIEATKMGAFDYVLKPFDIPSMLDLISQALKAGRFMRTKVAVDSVPDSFRGDALIGRSRAMQEVYKAIGRVAATDATVLIRGESGTGKELVARAIYQHSHRAQAPFLVINCVAIPETLLESELFGYEKGAFTGAASRRVGKVEQAHRGTLFLDEIGDMPVSIQAKLLRLLQERSIERLGGRRPIPVDVRILAATNRDLEEAVAQGRFRDDLFYRLNVVTLMLPPLRDRREDIPLLADYFLARFAAELGTPNPGLTAEARECLMAMDWPGNVRELANVIRKALIFNRGYPLEPADVLRAVGENGPEEASGRRVVSAGEEGGGGWLDRWIFEQLDQGRSERLFDELVDDFSARVIRAALEITGGNRTQAARLLGISRPTLLARMEKYGIRVEASVT
ncbi:two-component system, NtrC family, nitrogen regulation response regulator GlnG [Desulfacinum infernum DSM 9756]|uniref:DNA-binding transcriptional regulator NtrC n=1 Tax=Desulfacinum infernum DSM 9756 TaxID=1121391 RepID=A0A1M5F8C2_9BACT|nr:sigma-54 dependent transcriptional regulator [Desulfacinum infernum]SHF87726.1 two-component system, NtrC family, nitrogen regulation response regulator GlnG [Desulfacinum infernum DSM 9756]